MTDNEPQIATGQEPGEALKYLILFPIRGWHADRLVELMDWVATHTKLPPPHVNLPPHVTFHKPIQGMTGDEVANLVASMTLQVKRTRIKHGEHLFAFGKHYIVIPIHATNALANLWAGITRLLSSVPTYEHDPYAHDNTLHITIAAKTTDVFDKIWLDVRDTHIPSPDALAEQGQEILLESVELWKKPVKGGKWEFLREFPIPE